MKTSGLIFKKMFEGLGWTAAIIFVLTTCTGNSSELKKCDNVVVFSGLDHRGKEWISTDVKSDYIVVYFYPAAMTGGCTMQACNYRDDFIAFEKMNTVVVGISGDEFKNLKYFKEAFQLNFTLISDPKGIISKKFGIPIKDGGSIFRKIEGEDLKLVRAITTSRWTFILDKNRRIIYKNSQVNAADDSQEVLEAIKTHLKRQSETL